MAMTQRERAIAIVAGGVIGVGLLYGFVLDPLLKRLDEADTLLAANTADRDAALSLLDRKSRDTREWRTIANGRVPSDPSTAESQLLNRVSAAGDRAGLKLDLQARAAERENGFDRIQRTVSTTGNMSKLGEFLYALQTSDIPLRIVDLHIGSRKDGTDDLSLTMSIATLVLAPPKPGQTASMSEVLR